MKLTVDDITGVVGIMPSPSTPDAGSWRTRHSVNLDETARMTGLMIDSGVDILMTTGTFGECATLTFEELRDLAAAVIETNAGRIPIFPGVTTLNTRDTIDRARALLDLGADGLFVGRPMWLALDDAGVVRYYRDLAEAMPGTPLVVYDNPLAFKGKISAEAYKALAEIPEVVASKHVGGPTLERDLENIGDRIRILPLAPEWYPVAHKFPDRAKACWSGGVACAPAPIVALARAIEKHDWTRAKTISDKLVWAEAPMFPGGDLARFMDYSIQIGHLRFKAAGLIDPGPPRPPYLEVPQEYVAGALECGARWAALQREFELVRTA